MYQPELPELNLTIIQGTTFRQRLSVNDQGQPVPLTDRVFKGVIASRPNGIPICEIEIDMLDQSQEPGQFEIVVKAQTSSKFPMNPTPKVVLVPTVFAHAITVTYNSRPNDPEIFALGRVFVYPKAGS